ncbi:hypothetical protein U1839_26615, partial [Sphingomonas sp. RT2P30]|uniref:hypothetical protein n=1 Tax=Parasphingomonas halimpatiens TaxID=3096162 RepID=UPI002FCC0BDB
CGSGVFASSYDLLFGSQAGRVQAETPLCSLSRFTEPPLDASPGVGPDVALQIKRGCTEYEVMCGPSDQYQFAPEQAAVERWLMARFRRSQPRPPSPRRYVLLEWAKFAWQIGDETSRDVVGALHPGRPIVVYDPGPPSAATGDCDISDTPTDN